MSTFYVCVDNTGYEVSLEERKIYHALDDQGERRRGQIRIIDESGEDYLYPVARFQALRLGATSRLASRLRFDEALAA